MDSRDYLRRYARGPLGIASLFVALGLGGLALALGGGPLLGLLAFGGSLALAGFLGLASGAGPRSAVAEGEREAAGRARAKMAAAAEARGRLAALRLPEGAVSRARDLVVLEAGRLVETFQSSGAWDPAAAEAVGDCLALVDAWKREGDETATERRFDLADANPFPEAEARTADALREKAALIAARRAGASGELSGADRLAIEEELK